MTTAATRTVVIEKEFPHPPEKVWRALTEGSLIKEWLMDNDFQPVVGHKFSFRSTPVPNWNGIIDCEVLVVEPNKKLSYTWGYVRARERRLLDVGPDKTGTLVRMEHSGFRFRSRGRLQGRDLRLAELHRWPGTSCRRAPITSASKGDLTMSVDVPKRSIFRWIHIIVSIPILRLHLQPV